MPDIQQNLIGYIGSMSIYGLVSGPLGCIYVYQSLVMAVRLTFRARRPSLVPTLYGMYIAKTFTYYQIMKHCRIFYNFCIQEPMFYLIQHNHLLSMFKPMVSFLVPKPTPSCSIHVQCYDSMPVTCGSCLIQHTFLLRCKTLSNILRFGQNDGMHFQL